MANKIISIEIGLKTIKLCEISYKKKKPFIYNCITLETPEDTFEDGYIRDKNKLTDFLKEKIKEEKIKGEKVIFTITSSRIANREITIPMVRDNQIQSVIETNATEYFPVEVSEYIFAYNILERIINKKEKKLRLSVYAAPNNLINNYYSVANLLGYEVEAIDYSGNSIVEILKKQIKTEANLMIQINEHTTLLSILDGNVLKLQRTIPYGTSSVVEAVLNNEMYQVKDEKEALQLLCSNEIINKKIDSPNEEVALTYADIEEESFVYSKKKREAEDITSSLSYLINNITRVLNYYLSKNKDKSINKIYIFGQGARILGIEELLKNETGIPTKKLGALTSVAFDKKIDISQSEESEYIACIGATIHPLRFTPKEYYLLLQRKQFLHYGKILIGIVVFSTLLVSYSFIQYKLEQKDNEILKEKVENLSDIHIIYDAHALAQKEYSQMKQIYDSTFSPNEKLEYLLLTFEEILPAKATVQTLDFAETDFTLGFKVDSKDTAAKVLQQLKSVPEITDISTEGITEIKDSNGMVSVQFQVRGRYNISKEGGDQREYE